MYVVPSGIIFPFDSDGVIVNGVLLHIAVVIAFITGVDLSITLTVNVAPVQFANVDGVTI